MSSYLDFELEIGEGSDQEHPLTVLRSPAGEARAILRWPFSELQLENRLKDLQIALLGSGGVRRQILSPAERAVQNFGRELFDLLFTGEVRSRYDVSQERASRQGAGLRLKLRIQSPRLAALPWEFLYDSRTAEYVCLSRNTPVVRYLELPQPIQPMSVETPLRILAMIASPVDQQPLDVLVERQRLERAMAELQARGQVQLTWLDGQSWRHLQRAMQRGPWHIFHFIGHGDYDPQRDEGLVAFADAQGKTQRFNASELGRLLADQRSLRLVLLNACNGAQAGTQDIFSSTAATLVRRGIPAVIAMQHSISDLAAIEFAQMFYESLADGLAVDAAVSEARKAISFGVSNSLEWGTPVLHMRAPDGHLFVTTSPMSAPPVQPVTEPKNPPTVQSKIQNPKSKIDFDWVTIPSGEFLMGSDKQKDDQAYDNETPQHKLYLPEYRIARVPVTVVQFEQFVKATGYKTTAEQQWSSWDYAGNRWREIEGAYWAKPRGENSDIQQKAKHPVTCISWLDAAEFCKWADVRLSSETEWEKAARGANGSIYPWGNEAPDKNCCNFNMEIGDTTPVSKYPTGKSFFSVLEMAGNVWEWTSTKWLGNYQDYAKKIDDSLEGDESRVVRGGAFLSNRRNVRCAYRDFYYPDYRSSLVGLRVCAGF